MDLVVRTPHGDADVTVANVSESTTLAELIGIVTAQAVPSVADVDGRTVDTATPLRRSGAMSGSVVSTAPAPIDPIDGAGVDLLQLCGRGAGTVRRLEAGRYRVGPGRRLSAAELGNGVVEAPMFQLLVGDGTVMIEPAAGAAVTLAGGGITDPTDWTHGDLVVGTRVFAVEIPARSRPDRRPDADPDGTVPFSRAPRFDDHGVRAPVVDALRDATGGGPGLWAVRPSDDRAFQIPFGMFEGPSRELATVDLNRETALAVVGSEAFRDGLSRALLVEAATLHGPADLDLVVATSPDRLMHWDWAKWLPHLRVDGDPRLLSSDDELAMWAEDMGAGTASGRHRWLGSHVSLVVIDDPDLWRRRDSPLQQLLASPPADLRVIVLCDRADQAPAMCRTAIEQNDAGRVRVTGAVAGDVLPALVEVEVAERIARHLAPLQDSELPPRRTAPADEFALPSLVEVLGDAVADPAAVRRRWDAAEARPGAAATVPIGVAPNGTVVEVDASTCLVFTGPTDSDVAAAAVTYLAALSTLHPPRAAPILHLHNGGASLLAEPLERFAHLAGRCSLDDEAQADRVLRRLEQVAAGSGTVYVAVEALNGQNPPDDAVTRLNELAARYDGICVITVTTATDCTVDASLHVTIGRRAGEIRGLSRDADGTGPTTLFVPFGPSREVGSTELHVRPMVFGRALTPLERRLDRPARPGPRVEVERATSELLATVGAAAGDERPTTLVPPDFPPEVDLDRLLLDHPGDAVPIGLVDDPGNASIDVAWWQPGSGGSILLAGSQRSGVDRMLTSVVVGIADRFSADDVHLYAVDSVARRRSVVDALPHAGATAHPDDIDRAAAIVDLLADEVTRRRSEVDVADSDRRGSGRAAIVLLVQDVTMLCRRLADSGHPDTPARLRDLAAAGDVGVTVVATATRPSDSCGLAEAVDDVYVGSVSSIGEVTELELRHDVIAQLDAGRCWSTTTDRLIQLATLGRPLTDAIDTAALEPPTSDAPARLDDPPGAASR